MTDKDEILAAIAAQGASLRDEMATRIDGLRNGLTAHVDESVNALAGITKAGFERVEKHISELKPAVDRIQTKLGRHETRIEDVETKVSAVETRVKALGPRP